MGQSGARDRLATVAPVPVTLHLYDLGQSSQVQGLNSILRPLGTGAFHCAVEICGLEWSYGWAPPGETGVFEGPPKGCDMHVYRESVEMGQAKMSVTDVAELIAVLSTDWAGADYDMLNRNCCHFSDTLCRWLGVGSIPDWIHRLADAGEALSAPLRWAAARKKSMSARATARMSQVLCATGLIVGMERGHASCVAAGKRSRGVTEYDENQYGDFLRGLFSSR